MDVLLGQFNLDSPLPTFFEVRAQEETQPMLKSAFRYALTVTAQRSPRLLAVLPYVDEIFTLIWAAVDARCLALVNSTFGEHFYGMTRVVLGPGGNSPGPQEEGAETPEDAGFGSARSHQSDQLGPFLPLSRRDRLFSVLVSVVVPYLRGRLSQLLQRLKDEGQTEEQARRRWEDQYPRLGPLIRASRKAFVVGYPWVNAAYEAATFIYWLRYLFESCWWSPWNHSRRILLKRMDYQDYVASSQHRFVEGIRYGLFGLVVVFKLLEWWHSTESLRQQLEEGAGRPIPAPPEPEKAVDLTGLRESQCPQCRQRTTNPTLNAASGHVYCYPCVHQYVEAHGKDPVTQIRSSLDHLRRIYETA
eukprot:TRINITY_DN13223_c0_g1_i1.p2 TRINITY_DN13223_c0_g1~~TRINITY_DN13223_c0_g1_i1.p2  ORF type:complete len:360 (+),score=111.43 TRINITY_DN13223_c0_g1_i1:62-1141(+)